MFAPKWYKESKLLLKGSQKFLDYKRDLLTEDRIAEIKSRQQDLKAAITAKDQEKVKEASRQLQAYCEKSMPRQMEQSGWQEQVEVIFVALVIALGLRTYFLQPFRIPTGSMEPTLNGIVIAPSNTPVKEPWIGQQVVDWILKGRTYQNVIADSDMYSTARKELGTLRDASWFLFTKTEVTFTTASGPKKFTFSAAPGEVQKQLLDRTGRPILFKKGQHVIGSYIDTGDLVLVDKFSYHFRRPKRGEVFVFDTRGIPTTSGAYNLTGNLSGQEGGTHFIKRLVGVPGDTLEIRSPELIVNGAPAHEFGMQRVAKAEGIYHVKNPSGYVLGDLNPGYPCPLSMPGSQLHLADQAAPGMREYAAMGDNTGNSLDSRYWGTVKEFNLAGPALLTLWPFTSGHWGIIR
jgi:signal peptidase I